jgi:hypothetical protein
MAKRGINEDSIGTYTPNCSKELRFDVEVPVQYIKRRCARADGPVSSETGEKIRGDRAMWTVILSLARPEYERRADMTVKCKGPMHSHINPNRLCGHSKFCKCFDVIRCTRRV